MQLCKLSSSSVSPFYHRKVTKETTKKCCRLSHNFPRHLLLMQSTSLLCWKQQQERKICKLIEKETREISEAAEDTKKWRKTSLVVFHRDSASLLLKTLISVEVDSNQTTHGFHYAGIEMESRGDDEWRALRGFLGNWRTRWLRLFQVDISYLELIANFRH